jgi:hypothetical protein
MTTTRILNDLNIPSVLARVNPTRSLLISSMPCEEQAANLRNLAVDQIEAKNTHGVGMRYLQNRQGYHTTFKKLVLFSLVTAACLRDLHRNPMNIRWFIQVAAIVFGIQIPPNLFNAWRFSQTAAGCQEWLIRQLSEKTFNKIEFLKYDRKKASSQVKHILENEKEDFPSTPKLRSKL